MKKWIKVRCDFDINNQEEAMLLINILKVTLKRNAHRFALADIHVHTVLYIHVYMGTKHCTSLKVLVVSIGLVCLSLVKVRLSKDGSGEGKLKNSVLRSRRPGCRL